MTGFVITRHGEARLSQRGIRRSDLDILLAHGAESGPDRIMLRKRDAAKAIRELKRQIARQVSVERKRASKDINL